jgi:serine/threonine protein kinase
VEPGEYMTGERPMMEETDFKNSGFLGRVLDRKYRLVRLIGEGGMGSVFEGEHILLGRKVAVKVMHPQFVSKPESVERFFREAKAASAIGHPNIVDVHDVGREDDDTVFIVMELLNGQCLDELIDSRGPLPAGQVISVALQVLSALGAAHAKGIIHRDMKAENVFLSLDSRGREDVKLLDFGIAKIEKGNKANLGLTKEGNVVGTPYYLAPEQARGGRDVDNRIDIWGVGVLLYEMLCGVLPFTGENYNEIIGKILLEAPRPIAELSPQAPPELIRVVEKAMAKEREERFADAQEMIEALYPLRRLAPDSSMSTMVIQTLKGTYGVQSSPPGSPVKSLRDSDPNARTSDLEPEGLQFVESSDGIATRRFIPLVAVGLAVVIGLAAVLTYAFVFDEAPQASGGGEALVPASTAPPQPVADEESPAPEASAEVPAPETAEGAIAEEAPPPASTAGAEGEGASVSKDSPGDARKESLGRRKKKSKKSTPWESNPFQ